MSAALNDKTVLISGASRGIGRAVALELAGEGADISFVYFKNSDAARELEEEVKACGVGVISLKTDIKDYAAVKSWVEETKTHFGSIDIVINNAGIVRDGALAVMDPAAWREVISTNLDGAFNLTRAAIVEFIKQKSGAVVNISSVSGVSGMSRQTNYSTSKAGMIGFTKSLAREVAPYNVRVNAVAPGFIETDMLKDLGDKYMDQMMGKIPLQRLGKADEVAKAVKFLVSESARYITGQTIVIDGGMTVNL